MGSTRAVVTIKDQSDTFHIYTHSDGYPEYQVVRIVKALEFAWPLPRFDAMDFSAAFVAASKKHGGEIYLTKDWREHGDLEFRYEVSARSGEYFGKGKGNPLLIAVFARGNGFDADEATYAPLWSGNLDAMKRKYPKYLEAA